MHIFIGKWKTANVAAEKNVRGIQGSLKKWSESLNVFVTKCNYRSLTKKRFPHGSIWSLSPSGFAGDT